MTDQTEPTDAEVEAVAMELAHELYGDPNKMWTTAIAALWGKLTK